MVPDHDCVPGLDRAVTVSEYAQLEGLSEAQVLSFIQELKIRKAAYFRGQWFIEAPPNCENRLAQLRAEQHARKSDDNTTNKQESLVEWVNSTIQQAQLKRLRGESSPPEYLINPHESELKHIRTQVPPPPAAAHQSAATQRPHAADKREHTPAESELARLRARVKTEMSAYESLTDSEKKALLTMTECAPLPQPVDRAAKIIRSLSCLLRRL